jgi:hypothetical protein
MAADRLVFRLHAVQRMFRRRISMADVRHILSSGETIEEYTWDADFRRKR